MESKWLTLLNYEIGEVNIYEITGEALEKYFELGEEEFIEQIVGLYINAVSWMFTWTEPFVTNEVLTLD